MGDAETAATRETRHRKCIIAPTRVAYGAAHSRDRDRDRERERGWGGVRERERARVQGETEGGDE